MSFQVFVVVVGHENVVKMGKIVAPFHLFGHHAEDTDEQCDRAHDTKRDVDGGVGEIGTFKGIAMGLGGGCGGVAEVVELHGGEWIIIL